MACAQTFRRLCMLRIFWCSFNELRATFEHTHCILSLTNPTVQWQHERGEAYFENHSYPVFVFFLQNMSAPPHAWIITKIVGIRPWGHRTNLVCREFRVQSPSLRNINKIPKISCWCLLRFEFFNRKIEVELINCNHYFILFYDAISVTRLYSVDDRVTGEWWWIDKGKHPYVKQDSNSRSKRWRPTPQTARSRGLGINSNRTGLLHTQKL
jgi:hypothetical protein